MMEFRWTYCRGRLGEGRPFSLCPGASDLPNPPMDSLRADYLRRVLFLLFPVLLLVGCGIPHYAYLEAPSTSPNSDWSAYEAKFWNTTQNNPSLFQGFQLYYKFFVGEEEWNKGIAKIKKFQDLTSGSNDYFLLTQGVNQQETINGKVYDAGEVVSQSPLVRLTEEQKSQTIEFIIDFGPDQIDEQEIIFDSYLNLKYGASSTSAIPLCRYPVQNRTNETATDSVARSFKKKAFYEEDGDIPKDYGSGDDLYLSVFVMTFGRENDGTALYSAPKSLGGFKLTPDPLNN